MVPSDQRVSESDALRERLSNWIGACFPNRPPTWTEVGIVTVCVLVYVPQLIFSAAVSWTMVAVGIVTTIGLIVGGSHSTAGRKFGSWFKSISGGSRITLILVFVIAIGTISILTPLSYVQFGNLGTGGIVAIFFYTIAHVLWAGKISEWQSK